MRALPPSARRLRGRATARIPRALRPLAAALLALVSPGEAGAGTPAAAPWAGPGIRDESVLFVEETPGEAPVARLLFPPARIEAVRSANGRTAYAEGRDYVVDAPARALRLPPGSRIPWKRRAELRPKAGTSPSAAPGAKGEDDVFTAEGHVLHDLQASVTYAHAGPWDGPAPSFAGAALPGTVARLRARQPLRVSLVGDSIGHGLGASGFTGAPPYQPPFGELLVSGLRAAYGGEIAFANPSVPGLDTATALELAPAIAATRPDLVVVALGLNDASHRVPPGELRSNVKRILAAFRAVNPDVEFVLVAPLLANPAWSEAAPELQERYRDALVGLRGKGVAVADLTSLWAWMLARKGYFDVSANGLNHPNDFGHRLYAEAVVALLVPREATKSEPSATAPSRDALATPSARTSAGR